MEIRDGFAGSVGETPLVRLRRISEETGCEILGKAEFMNPGGSVKDRAALGIIEAAERNGRLKAGGIVVEGTAGNTGIGLAHICNTRGYRCIIVMPETQSREKFEILETLGAEVRAVSAVPYRDPGNYQHVAGSLAGELENAVWANQFDNTANREYHERTTGAEILAQTDGGVDAFVAATGTGGTLAGVGRALKAHNSDIQIVLADPHGSGLYEWAANGEIKVEGSSITEGIGNGRVTGNLEGTPIDDAVRIGDPEAVAMVYRLLREEGLLLGGSSGINVCAAIEVAKRLGPGHTIVTVLCDGGDRYRSRLFNREWLESKGLADSAG
jgi:cysteine synthase A